MAVLNNLKFLSSGFLKMASGTDTERPTPADGLIRHNSERNTVEYGRTDANVFLSLNKRFDFTSFRFQGRTTGNLATGPDNASDAGYDTTTNPWITNANNPEDSPNLIFSSGRQRFTVPKKGVYRIRAVGAEGGEGSTAGTPGRGAAVEGEFYFVKDEILTIIVGQCPNASGEGSGGGGASAVILDPEDEPLVIAGGGGGVGDTFSGDANGVDANTGTSGTDPRGPSNGQTGGVDGDGGQGSTAGGGAGFLTDGGNGSRGDGGTRLEGFATGGGAFDGSNGLNGGGFGGGGQEGSTGDNEGGGGGGGFSGGAGGDGSNDQGGGGGGSFVSSRARNVSTSNGSLTTTGNERRSCYVGPVGNLGFYNANGNGYVDIEFLGEL